MTRLAPGILEQPPSSTVDVLVVGSGPGGAVAAAELARGGRNVLIVEDAPAPDGPEPRAFGIREMEERYRGGGVTPALGPSPVTYVEGRCLGGGSEINSGLYHRTPGDVMDAWRASHGVQEFREEDLAPHFEAVEGTLDIGFHPTGGGPASRKLHDGASALGWAAVEVPRWVDASVDGQDRIQEQRRSMRRSYLVQAVEAGARILTGCRVVRIRHRGDGWTAEARFSSPEGTRRIRLGAGTVVLAAGAIQTPAVLRRSGLGHHVGDTLALHPTAKMVAVFPDDVHDEGVGVHQVPHFKPDFSLGCSVSTAPYQALALLEHRDALQAVPERARRTAIYYAMTTGGKGTVRPVRGFADPLVRYDVGGDVRERLSRGLLALGSALLAAGAEALYPAVSGVAPVRDRPGLAGIPPVLPVDGANLMTVHLMASCPMGERRDRCAVDSYGHVHGETGLVVSDASIFSGPVGVNPQGTVMALARRNALRMLGQA